MEILMCKCPKYSKNYKRGIIGLKGNRYFCKYIIAQLAIVPLVIVNILCQ